MSPSLGIPSLLIPTSTTQLTQSTISCFLSAPCYVHLSVSLPSYAHQLFVRPFNADLQARKALDFTEQRIMPSIARDRPWKTMLLLLLIFGASCRFTWRFLALSLHRSMPTTFGMSIGLIGSTWRLWRSDQNTHTRTSEPRISSGVTGTRLFSGMTRQTTTKRIKLDVVKCVW